MNEADFWHSLPVRRLERRGLGVVALPDGVDPAAAPGAIVSRLNGYDRALGDVFAHIAPAQSAALAAAVVLTTILLAKSAPQLRRKMPRAAVFLGMSLVAGLAATAFDVAGSPSWAGRVDAAADALRLFTVFAVIAPLVFGLACARFSISIPNIAQELIAGIGYSLALVELFHRWGFNLWSLVATSAVATAVVGLSLQPTLGNLVGGLTLQVDGSIGEGDWVRLSDTKDGKVEGKIREIRWRYTVIETRNGDAIVLPNASLLQQQLLVLGRRGAESYPHRMWVYFDVGYRFPPDRVIDAVLDALRVGPIPNVATDPAPDCICMGFGVDGHEGVARYAVRYWLTNLAVDDPTSSAVLTRIYGGLARADIALGVPRHDLSVTRNSGRREQAEREREFARRLALLDAIELFRTLTEDERRKLVPTLRPAPFARGEVITRQGAEAHWLYLLVKGSVEVIVKNDQGVERHVNTIEAPGFFGEMSLMTGAPRASTVTARTAVECLRLDRVDFRELVAARPAIADEVSHVLAERRITLLAARDGAGDAAGRGARMDDERGRISAAIRRFFGLAQA